MGDSGRARVCCAPESSTVAGRSFVPGQQDEAVREFRGMVRGAARQFAADARHPLRHPGNTFLDLLTLATLGGAGALRVPRAVQAAKDARRRGRLARRDIGEAVHGKRHGPDPIEQATHDAIRHAMLTRLGPGGFKEAARAARKDARTGQTKKGGRTVVKSFERSLFRPLVYPVTKTVELTRAPASLERNVDALGLALATDATMRRAANAARRSRDAGRVVTYR